MQQRTLLRRVLEIAHEKVLRRVLRRCLAVGFNGKKCSEKGSQKGLLRRHLEGRSTRFREYDPRGVRPLGNCRGDLHDLVDRQRLYDESIQEIIALRLPTAPRAPMSMCVCV